MTMIATYSQIDAPDPVNPSDLATKNYVDNLLTISTVLPPGTVIKQSGWAYAGNFTAMAGPQTNHGWSSANIQKLRSDTTFNVAFSGSTYVTVAQMTSYNIQVGSSGIVACAQYFFNQANTHESWYGMAFNAGGVGLVGAVLVQTYFTFTSGTMTSNTDDRMSVVVTEVMPG